MGVMVGGKRSFQHYLFRGGSNLVFWGLERMCLRMGIFSGVSSWSWVRGGYLIFQPLFLGRVSLVGVLVGIYHDSRFIRGIEASCIGGCLGEEDGCVEKCAAGGWGIIRWG